MNHPTRRTFHTLPLWLTLLAGAVLALAACGTEAGEAPAAAPDSASAQADSAEASADTAAAPEATTPADSARVDVVDFKYSKLPSGTRVFSGTLVNRTAKKIAFAQVQVSLLDGDNRRVSTASIEVRNVPAKGRTPFQQPLDSDEPFQAARVRSVLLP